MIIKRKMKLKPFARLIVKILLSIIVIFSLSFAFYRNQINQLKKIGYSEQSSNKILFSMKKKDVLEIGENKTLNAAFMSNYYKEKNFDNYTHIKYQKHKNLIKNINILLKKDYSNNDISLILAHGSDSDVCEFAKRDKVRYLEEFFSYDFAKLKYYDRYVNYSDETGEDEETSVIAVNLDLDKEQYTDPIIISNFTQDVLVTKHRQLSDKYVPDNLVSFDNKYTDDDIKGEKIAVNAFVKMAKAAESENLGLIINSGYRSFEDQKELCDEYRKIYGDSYVEKYVAKEGFSEHQTGMAFDIGGKSNKVFANSKEYEWVQNNAYKYGFIQRFPKRYENITGFRYESWHYRYVGIKIATYLHEHKMSYDEYYVRFLDNK